MAEDSQLTGSCTCGRYVYAIHIPSDTHARRAAQVFLSTSQHDRRPPDSLLSAHLHIPLQWYQSRTRAFFPDERHELIARTFSPMAQPTQQQKFCGYCGTHISYWTEEPADEAEFMNVTLGSLRGDSIDRLDELDLLPQDSDSQDVSQKAGGSQITAATSDGKQAITQTPSNSEIIRKSSSGRAGNIAWLEDMIQGSRLGMHSTKRRGYGTSADGSTHLQWEVSEYYDEEDEPRKKSVKTPMNTDTMMRE